MYPKKCIEAGGHAVPQFVPPRGRPVIVFSRDDGSGAGKAPAGPARVLIVEDDYLVGTQMQGALTQAGFEVVGVASSAEEAIELAAAERPMLAVMDIRLQGQRDGVDAALALFANHGIRCIFATAYHTAETRARARTAQPLAWIPKPYSVRSLVEAVEEACRALKAERG